MAVSANRPRWQRIYRQTVSLTYKNLLVFYKTPISTIFRALVIPIVFTIVMCKLKHISATSVYSEPNAGVASLATPIQDLNIAMKTSGANRLVFVRDDTLSALADPIIKRVLQQPAMQGANTVTSNNQTDLLNLCKQSLNGESKCFAAVIFNALNETNVDYSIVLDSHMDGYDSGNFRKPGLAAKRVLPIQWAINAAIGNLEASSKPSEQAWSGYFYTSLGNPEEPVAEVTGPVWLTYIALFVAPVFIIILIGITYHLSVLVATERQSQISELMQAQMVTDAPRILSTILSFIILYFPGLLICSILLTQLLFVKTSDILLLFLTLLAGLSTIVSSHFLASFFRKGQVAGLYTSTLTFALALITLTTQISKSPEAQNYALSFIFPPYCFATLIADVAKSEYILLAFSFTKKLSVPVGAEGIISKGEAPVFAGYVYFAFFVVQIIVYGAATYGIERGLWGVKREFRPIESTSDVALRFTKLSKTYHSKRAWYWPFKAKARNLAVDGLDLEVKKGSVTFLLGPNGGGKTTTLKCAAGMHTMDLGSRLEINEAGVVFGICPQQNVFWDNLTVKEHVEIWRKLKTAAFPDLMADDDDVIAECDLLEKTNSVAKSLSGGQMRKLQLAISFVGGSKVCCIDEASSGLDPLSRRNIWNIIQKGHTRRTILITTHFLDEADVLADHIAILYKGKLVCEGPGTSLKARFGGDYLIHGPSVTGMEPATWQTTNSAEATRKILELEALSDKDTYNITFPTLEQVFLRVTSDSNTVVNKNNGDGIVGEQEAATETDEKACSEETSRPIDMDLDVGRTIGTFRQVKTLFTKRYTLLLQRSGWITYAINLIIPILIAAVLVNYIRRNRDLETCEQYAHRLGAGYQVVEDYNSGFYVSSSSSYITDVIILAPASEFSGPIQDDIFANTFQSQMRTYGEYGNSILPSKNETLLYRGFVNDKAGIMATITNGSAYFNGIAVFAPTASSAVLLYRTASYDIDKAMAGMSYITNRLVNSTTTSGMARAVSVDLRWFPYLESDVSFYSMPISLLLVLAFIAAASIAVMYPAFEKINRVRALHYCNGVSPFGLWLGYLLFDIQFIVIQSVIVWAVLFAGSMTRLYFEPTYILGAFILFGITTYLGTYLLSLYIKKAAFAIAAGIHILLFICYFAAYIGIQSGNTAMKQHELYSIIQYTLGLTSPGANLGRALFVSMNVFDVLCGKYGDADLPAFAYVRYGSVYANLLIQIAFLSLALAIHEYGSAESFRRLFRFRKHRSLPDSTIDNSDIPLNTVVETKTRTSMSLEKGSKILNVSHVTKYFGRNFATEDISFDVSSNETLALLGGNGAGKTTMINLIRSELKPDFGEIHLDGISVLQHPQKTRSQMGVCPQDDAVDNLTVRQTLKFYASVKGLKNVEGNVAKVMAALNITMFEHVMVKALSGGTKRKLSVAIALIGNPRILLLDEPSTGQDAGAKRILWKALQDISANRAILLTTHSMEEAEALATNVAIMGTKMLAKGTLGTLQEKYGGLYAVRAVRVTGTSAAEVEEVIRERFAHKVSNYEDSYGQISFNLPHDKRSLGSILRIMEALKGHIIRTGDVDMEVLASQPFLQDYTINGPTLEEVFMNVARESGIAGGV